MIDKKAQAEHPIHELLARRWSPRAFAEREVEPEKLRRVFEAARWAPSCFNEQPWRFLVAAKVADPEGWERLLGCLVEKNQQWARSAPVLFLSTARSTFSRNDRPNRHARHDVGMATQNLATQAVECGLSTHFMAGFSADKAIESLGIPEGYEPVAMGALGYQGEIDRIPESFHEAERSPRQRRPLEETLFGAGWGERASFLEG